MNHLIGIGHLFMPEEFLPLFIAVGGIAWMVGAKRLASGLITFAITAAILPALLLPLTEPLLQMVPVWVLWILAAYGLFLVPYVLLSLFGSLVAPALGRSPTNSMVGQMAASMSVRLLGAPFRLVGVLLRGVGTMIRAMKGRP